MWIPGAHIVVSSCNLFQRDRYFRATIIAVGSVFQVVNPVSIDYLQAIKNELAVGQLQRISESYDDFLHRDSKPREGLRVLCSPETANQGKVLG